MPPKKMTVEELLDSAHDYFEIASMMSFLGNHIGAARCRELADRDERRADLITQGKNDPA
ncbi:MAG: hypothetical protein J7K84_10710 [Deltaproteobacteria bacterium]|nr:hypothetical protein [Deltaproteobacteria bacterium]